MKKRFYTALILSLLVVASVVIATALPSKQTLTLTNNQGATGTAELKNVPSRFLVDDTSIILKVENLPPQSGRVYEGWLVDLDTGYKLSLGAFVTQDNGRGELRFKQNIVNYELYDMIVVTKEVVDDTLPQQGPVVFGTIIPGSLHGKTYELFAHMEGRHENPTTTSSAAGFGDFVIDTQNNTLTYHIQYFNLEGNETGAHIHGVAPTDQNAGVLTDLPGGMTKDGSWNYPEELETAILAGQTYVNIHSTSYPDGAIRGQIMLEH